jgi:hypothetical protein
MATPTVTFLYNSSGTDTAYTGTGAADGNFGVINISSNKLIFTGGGIDDTILTTPTCASGTRSPTIRPSSGSYIIPKVYVEDATLMHHCPLPGQNANQYCMCVYVNGTASSIMYLEAWDDSTLSTTALPVLQGSTASSDESYVNAVATTNGAPDPSWTGGSANAAYLRGTETGKRIALDASSPITDKALYYSIYIRLYDDSSTFHNTPVLAFRYLYT